jgi:hypothetical protein
MYDNQERHKKHKVLPLKNCIDTIKGENKAFKFEAKEKLNLIENSIRICNANKYLMDIGYYNVHDSITKEFSEIV